MITAEILRKKRDGGDLSLEEIRWIAHGVISGAVSEPQAGAFLMAACTRGLSAAETTFLTQAMAESGTKFAFKTLGKPVVDKHSTGGVGDKISLLLAPLAASCGLLVPMISGRGLGHTGGTVDKLESVVGMKMNFSEEEFVQLLRKNGVFMAKQTADIAPSDGVLYHLRDITGTVESVGLITASILSKKFAEGLDALVMDVKVGQGAFMPTFDAARELAESMMNVARKAGLAMRILFTKMDEPLGKTVGNWLEIKESREALAGNSPDDIRELSEHLCVAMLLAGGLFRETDSALAHVRATWESGDALRVFDNMIQAQGGNIEESEQRYRVIPKRGIFAKKDGIIENIHARTIGLAGITLGAGRKKSDDHLDFGAGIIFHKKVGNEVRCGEEICTLQARNSVLFDEAEQLISSAITVGHLAPKQTSRVLEEWS